MNLIRQENRFLIGRSMLACVMDELRRLGMTGICVDPSKSSSERRFTFKEIDPGLRDQAPPRLGRQVGRLLRAKGVYPRRVA